MLETAPAPVENWGARASLMSKQPGSAWDRVTKYLERACVEEDVPDWPTALIARPPGYLRSASMWWTDAEVNNGGLSQYFLNSTNEVVWHAIAGYERIGQTRMAEILRSAVVVCSKESPELLRADVPPGALDGFVPLAGDLDSLDELYYEELLRLPIGNGIENDCYLNGTVEYYWNAFPEDFGEQTGK